MEDKYYHIDSHFGEPRTSKTLTIKKFNKENQLCKYDSIDLTCCKIDDKALNLFIKMFESEGYKTEIKERTYFGIYDPSRMAELIEIYPTNEELLEKDIRFLKVNPRKLFGLF